MARRRIRGEVLLQVRLVPDLPRLDRKRRRLGPEPLVVVGGPVDPARSVPRHERLEEVSPPLLGLRPADRRGRRGAGQPARVAPHRGDRANAVRGEGADEPVHRVPLEVALGRLHRAPVEDEAVGPDLGRLHPLDVRVVEGRSLDDPEELGAHRRAPPPTDAISSETASTPSTTAIRLKRIPTLGPLPCTSTPTSLLTRARGRSAPHERRAARGSSGSDRERSGRSRAHVSGRIDRPDREAVGAVGERRGRER